jgi:hypothetical protein
MQSRRTRSVALLAASCLLLVGLTACNGGAGSSSTPGSTPRPTPTPIVTRISNAADAAALVIASDPRFGGAIELKPGLIGASKYWKAEALVSGGYRIELTIGWGDCPAGCIERHVWTYDVDANGGMTLVSESGDPMPSEIPA